MHVSDLSLISWPNLRLNPRTMHVQSSTANAHNVKPRGQGVCETGQLFITLDWSLWNVSSCVYRRL